MFPAFGFLLSAVLGIASFPPIGAWPLAYVAMVPFLASAASLAPRRALKWGYASGLLFFAGLLYWIGLNSGAPPGLTWASAAGVVAILATVWAITAWAVARASKRFGLGWAALLFVALYVFFEVFWGTGEMGLPWAVWGLTQTAFLPALQLADLGDVYGLSAWVLTLNALLFLTWKLPRARRRMLIAFAVVLIVPLVYGLTRLSTYPLGPRVPVAAVQVNTAAVEKWHTAVEDMVEAHLQASGRLSHTDTRLVVWPETAVPAPIRHRPLMQSEIQNFCDTTGRSLLTGTSHYELDATGEMQPYNAAFLFHPGAREPLHSAKVHLVPFGERIPGQKLFPFLGNLHLGQAEWVPASDVVVFPAQNGVPALGCLICFEVVFPDIGARMVMHGAHLLTTITNDGWYGNSSGPYQHLELARLRAVAMRRSIVRAAGTGISAVILPTGRSVGELGYDRVGVVTGDAAMQTEITLAARMACVWPFLYTGLLLVVLGALFVKSRRDKTPGRAA